MIRLNEDLRSAVHIMTSEISGILKESNPSVYLYGSVVLNDFKKGWSDIDLLVLTQKPISIGQAEKLVNLRQVLVEREGRNSLFRSFEGGMISLDALLQGKKETAVYWGTSGQRIKEGYSLDSFAKYQIKNDSILVYGKDVRNRIETPANVELYADVKRHYEAIRQYCVKTDRSIYSYGWFLDIARCIYTMRTGRIIAKTKAGEWALEQGLCPNRQALERALAIRKNPALYLDDQSVQDDAEHQGEDVQRFADVLELELNKLI